MTVDQVDSNHARLMRVATLLRDEGYPRLDAEIVTGLLLGRLWRRVAEIPPGEWGHISSETALRIGTLAESIVRTVYDA